MDEQLDGNALGVLDATSEGTVAPTLGETDVVRVNDSVELGDVVTDRVIDCAREFESVDVMVGDEESTFAADSVARIVGEMLAVADGELVIGIDCDGEADTETLTDVV